MTTQTWPVVIIQDYEYDAQNKPLSNVEVAVTLDYDRATLAASVLSTTPNVQNKTNKVRTGADGFWSMPVTRNSDLVPTTTGYILSVRGGRSYRLVVPAGPGPFVASALATS